MFVVTLTLFVKLHRTAQQVLSYTVGPLVVDARELQTLRPVWQLREDRLAANTGCMGGVLA